MAIELEGLNEVLRSIEAIADTSDIEAALG